MLEIINLNKTFKNTKVLDYVNLTINNNEIVGLLGPNGAGKTTLIKIICQLVSPDSGIIKLNNSAVKMSDINIAFEGIRNMYWPLTVRENYYYLAALKGVFKTSVDYILENDARYSNIKPLLKKPYGELSLGQKKIAAVMASLLSNPKLICLDEPSNGLDINYQNNLVDIITTFGKESDRKTLVSSHDLDFLFRTVDRFIIINKGKIVDGFLNKNMSFEELEIKYKNCMLWEE